MSITMAQYRVLALGGLFQAASLTNQLAKTGRAAEPFFSASINSLFSLKPEDALEVYGDASQVSLGLNEMIRLLTHNALPKEADIARYAFSLLHLQTKLSAKPDMLEQIRIGVERAQWQAQHFSTTHENVMANLASLYSDTLSTFRFRIHVSGEPLYLNQTATINKIRALLLSGIRSAILWRQLDGKRWQLLINRRSIIQSAQQWLTAPVERPSKVL